MRSMRVGLVSLVASFTLLSCASLESFDNRDITRDMTTWKFAAPPTAIAVGSSAAKKLLPKLVGNDPDFKERMGFGGGTVLTLPQPSGLDVNSPFPVFDISAERLANFNPLQQSPISLLLEKNNFLRWSVPVPSKFLFPITFGGAVKSSVLVAMSVTDHGWRMHQIGSPETIRKLTQHGTPPNYFVVRIFALNRSYLGKIVGTDFKIKHVVNERVHNIEIPEGTEEPAVAVFKRLLPDAVEVSANQMPR